MLCKKTLFCDPFKKKKINQVLWNAQGWDRSLFAPTSTTCNVWHFKNLQKLKIYLAVKELFNNNFSANTYRVT